VLSVEASRLARNARLARACRARPGNTRRGGCGLALSKSTIRRLIVEGALPANQHCKGAPWIIQQVDLERAEIRRQANTRRSRRPPPDERQHNLPDLSM